MSSLACRAADQDASGARVIMASKDKKVMVLALLEKDIDRMASPRQLDRCWNPGVSRKLGYPLQALLKLFFAVLWQAEGGVDGEEVKRGPDGRKRDGLSRGLGARWFAFNAVENAGEWRGRAASLSIRQVNHHGR
jgi:hypothetical protein